MGRHQLSPGFSAGFSLSLPFSPLPPPAGLLPSASLTLGPAALRKNSQIPWPKLDTVTLSPAEAQLERC